MATKLDIPTLDTDRLVLRGFELADLEASVALWGDPEVTRYIGGRPFSAEETWARMLRNVGHWALQGFGYWVAIERASGRFAGQVGLMDLHREVEPSLSGVPEAGWVMAPWCAGRGLATEAVAAVLTWSGRALGAARVVCLIDVANAASRRVAAKCGFRHFADATYHANPVQLFERFAAATGT